MISRNKSHLPVKDPSKSSKRVLGRELEGMLLIKDHGDFGGSGGVMMSGCFAVKCQGSGRLPVAAY